MQIANLLMPGGMEEKMDFYKRVAMVCKHIPYGKVATYGQVALLCGKPKNSRQVGYALNKRMVEENIPTHRVVNHQGYLSGAKAFATSETQRTRLEAEGVVVDDENRVDLREYGWKNTLEDALYLRASFEKYEEELL